MGCSEHVDILSGLWSKNNAREIAETSSQRGIRKTAAATPAHLRQSSITLLEISTTSFPLQTQFKSHLTKSSWAPMKILSHFRQKLLRHKHFLLLLLRHYAKIWYLQFDKVFLI